MKLIDTYARLLQMGPSVFQTSDAAAYLGIPVGHTSVSLARLAKAGHLIYLRRSVWAIPGKTDPLALPEILTRPFPSYVSLQSALYYHGMISQIPTVIYAVSIGRTRRFKTPIGAVSIHHLQPEFFFGFEPVGERGVYMATPEKALLDIVYLSPAKSNLFRALPELEMPTKFNFKTMQRMVERIPSQIRRALVERRLKQLLPAAKLALARSSLLTERIPVE